MNILLILPVLLPVALGLIWYGLKLTGKRLNLATFLTVLCSAGAFSFSWWL